MNEIQMPAALPRHDPPTAAHGFRLPKDLSAAIRVVAAQRDVAMTDVVVQWLRDRAVAEGYLPEKK
jgi:hypothetical protein